MTTTTMTTNDAVLAFFRGLETKAKPPADWPAWMTGLAAAHDKELAFDLAGAREALASIATQVPEGPFRRVAELLELRVLVREARADRTADAVARVRRLCETLAPEDRAIRARARHLIAVAEIRLGRLEHAEVALTDALEEADDGPVLVWMSDTFAQLLIGQGAWSEAIRTLRALVELRRRAGDTIGVAISGGHLVRLDVQLGRYEEAVTLARAILEELGPSAPVLTRLRIATLLTGALVELRDLDRLADAASELDTLARDAPPDTHYLRGYATMTLARAAAALGNDERARSSLDEAASEFTLPGHVAILEWHRLRIDPKLGEDPTWLSQVEKLWMSMDYVSEPEIQTRILLARSAYVTDEALAHRRTNEAYARAIESNNPLWLKWVDDVAAEIAPAALSEKVAVRFSGRPPEELERTKREDVTIIFSDLVSFTPRSLEMEPEDVLDTVRGLFELGVPIMIKHKVVPLSYMGDGLLAIAQGVDHERRGLAFARDFVARAGRISRLRRTLDNGWPLDLRAGVASGPVVLGTLGTLFKTEFAAIGVTTNLAARLQGAAQPGEVMCFERTARAAGLDAPPETLKLKGFEKWGDAVRACRIHVYSPLPPKP